MKLKVMVIPIILLAKSASADASANCDRLGIGLFEVPVEVAREFVPDQYKNSMQIRDDQVMVSVNLGVDCTLRIDGADAGQTDIVRISVNHEDNPETGQPGDGLLIRIGGYSNNRGLALHAPQTFSYDPDVDVSFDAATQFLQAKIPDGKIEVRFLEIVEADAIPLPAKDFFILTHAPKAPRPNMACGWEEVGQILSPPHPETKPTFTGDHALLSKSTPAASLLLGDIECIYSDNG